MTHWFVTQLETNLTSHSALLTAFFLLSRLKTLYDSVTLYCVHRGYEGNEKSEQKPFKDALKMETPQY